MEFQSVRFRVVGHEAIALDGIFWIMDLEEIRCNVFQLLKREVSSDDVNLRNVFKLTTTSMYNFWGRLKRWM